MAVISIKNLTFAYEGSYDNVFENTSLTLDTDWKLGLIGRNGRGKTTLLRLLMGGYSYKGSISSPVAFDYFPFETADINKNTAEIIAEIVPDYQQWQLSCELNQMNVSEDTLERPFATLSNGERTKLLLAALFMKENNFLLIDEPTNHLDAEARRSVAEYLNRKKGFILVSHDRAFLDACIDHVLSINRATIEVQKGNYTSWQRNKEARDNFELAENKRLALEIDRLKQSVMRTEGWASKIEASKSGSGDRGYIGHCSAIMMQRAKAIEKRKERMIADKESLMHDVEYNEPLKIHSEPYFKETLIGLSDFTVRYGERQIFDNVAFSVKRGDRIALKGRNGCGKSSILKLIAGEKIDYTGVLEIGSRLKISYVPQDMSFLKGDLDDFSARSGIDETLFKTILRKLDFKRTQFEKDMADYSMGQKKKILLAKSLCERANIYIWDEPLNYIDVISRLQIEALILEYKPTMLFVEHDKAFTDGIATDSIIIG